MERTVNDDAKYVFDLNGYLVLREVMSPDQVARCNRAIDHHADQLEPHERRLEGDSQVLASEVRQHWMSGMLTWDAPWCEPFRELLVHPRVSSCLTEILGSGWRINVGPDLVTMETGCAGHYLHGGGVERPDFTQTYMWKHGKIYCGMTVVEFMLSDEGPGDGGLAIVPGGHKSNYPLPQALQFYEAHQELVKGNRSAPLAGWGRGAEWLRADINEWGSGLKAAARALAAETRQPDRPS